MNIDHIKKEFPIFDEKIQNNDLVYLDSANSSQKPLVVIKIELMIFIQNNFQMLVEVFIILRLLQQIYMKIQDHQYKNYINAKDKNEIVFTKVLQKL